MSNSFVHQYIPASNPEEKRTLLLLHGTGGNEHDLIPLGESLLPGAAILSPRGRISEGGMPRFFRRFGEGVFDLENLKTEAAALTEFVQESAVRYGFDPSQVIGVGFSNGANMAHSLLLLHPEVLQEVVAIRAMTTFPDAKATGLEGKRVFISSGRLDPIVPNQDAENLARQLREGGAEITHHWVEGGHNLTRDEIGTMNGWLSK